MGHFSDPEFVTFGSKDDPNSLREPHKLQYLTKGMVIKMTLETVIMLSAFSIFALCSALFITRTTAASSFRNKIAAPHGFAEGAAVGPAYPLWILSYGLLFVQCAAFMAFPSTGEIDLNRRILIFTATLIIFFLLRSVNMPLLAVWFGKTGIWISHGFNGLIKFESIVACEITKQRKNTDDPNAMCTVVFYTEKRRGPFHNGKYACRVTHGELLPYLPRLPIVKDARKVAAEHSPISSAMRLFSQLSTLLTLFGCICFVFSTALLSPYSYTESLTAEENEFKTYAPITDALEENGMTAVRHEGVEVVNVYSGDGVFAWSISRKRDFFPNPGDGISAANGILRYTVNGSDRYFRITDGKELSEEEITETDFPTADALRPMNFEFHPLYIRKQLSDRSYKYTVNRPPLYSLFIPSVAWGILLFGASSLYLLHLITEIAAQKNTPQKSTSENTAPSESETE